MFKHSLEFGPVSGPPLPFRVKAFVSLMSVLLGFALSYLVWGVVSLVQFDRVLDAGSMIFYPGLAALGLWLAVLLPLTLKFSTDHRIFQLEGSILRGGGTTLGLYLIVLLVVQLGPWRALSPFEMFKLLPGISLMFLVVAFLLGALALPLYIIFSRFLRGAFEASSTQASRSQDQLIGKVRQGIEVLLQDRPETSREWEQGLRKIYHRLPGADKSAIPAPPSPAREGGEEDPAEETEGTQGGATEQDASRPEQS